MDRKGGFGKLSMAGDLESVSNPQQGAKRGFALAPSSQGLMRSQTPRGNMPVKGRAGRTYSVDTGLSALVTQFYEEKLEEAKSKADEDLRKFVKDAAQVAAEQTNDAEVTKALSMLKYISRQILATDPFALAEGKFKALIADLMKLLKPPELENSTPADRSASSSFRNLRRPKNAAPLPAVNPIITKLCNKLLLIVASFSRLLGYLDVDNQEMEEFIKIAADEFRKIHLKGGQKKGNAVNNPVKKEVPAEPVVCRICEKKIRGDRIKGHTEKCIQITNIAKECESIDKQLQEAIDDVRLEMGRDSDDKRATRRMTFIPGFANDGLVEEYIEKCASILDEKDFKQYKRILRSYFSDPNPQSSMSKLTTEVKKIFKDDSRFTLLKGFIQFMPPDVQVNYFMEEMNKVWDREESELKMREDIFEKMNQNVKSVISLQPRSMDSYERCLQRYRHFQQLTALFSTKSCEGQLKKRIKHLESLIRSKFLKLQEVFDDTVAAAIVDPMAEVAQEESSDDATKVTIKDFEIVKPISRGSYGSVFLAKKKKTGDVYAIKLLKKKGMKTKNDIKNLYMVMEYLNGGDCFSLLRELTQFSEEMARQYVAETVLALGYLHSIGVVHRDLKPDNMLIDSKGHVKLTDFGLSKMGLLSKQEEKKDWTLENAIGITEACKETSGEEEDEKDKAHTAVGTPDYIAPEVFLGTGCGPEVDWWALGCILYEFLVGITPFYGESLEEIFNNILAGNLMWPEDEALTEDAVDLIERLLTFEPAERLGGKGVEEVKSHPFFSSVKWDTLLEQEAVFVPQTDDIFDTSYFNARNEMYQVDDDEMDEDDDGDDGLDSE